MSKYETYKHSAIEWVGHVPKHWQIKRLKDFSTMQSGESITSDEISDEAEYPVYGGNGMRGYFSLFTHEGTYVLIGRQGALCGNINYAHGKFWASEHAVVVTETKGYNFYWLGELLRIMDLNQYSQASAQPGLSVEKIIFLKVPVPPVTEQLAIANYLDEKIQKIDQLIANKRAQVEKLKELRQIEINNGVTKGLNPNVEVKDSGFDWLGKIPNHWDVKRLKNLTNQVSEKSSEILEKDFLIALENIESNTGKFIDTATEYENIGIKFKKNNVLYNKLRPYLSKVYLADKDGICVGDIIVIECTQKLHPAFLQFRMLSDGFCSIIMSSVYGAKMPRTSWQFISSIKIGYPSIDEQIEIAEYLQKRTVAIESLVQNIEIQIEKLQELRKIKIYEAVTGKIKVETYAEATA
jgi:type I restriction enzyme S subunit